MKHEQRIRSLAKKIRKLGYGEQMFKGKKYADLPKVVMPETYQKMGELGDLLAHLILESLGEKER